MSSPQTTSDAATDGASDTPALRRWRGAFFVPRPSPLVLLLALAACGEAPIGVDAGLVDAVAELHLADAVAEADSLDEAAARALRRQALAAHGLDSAALADRLRVLASEPDALGALYDSVALRLTRERQGLDADTAAARLDEAVERTGGEDEPG